MNVAYTCEECGSHRRRYRVSPWRRTGGKPWRSWRVQVLWDNEKTKSLGPNLQDGCNGWQEKDNVSCKSHEEDFWHNITLYIVDIHITNNFIHLRMIITDTFKAFCMKLPIELRVLFFSFLNKHYRLVVK